MHAFFNSLNTSSQGIVKFPDWLYVRDGLRRNLGTVVQYYRKNPMAVKGSHFLVRLLQSITIPQSQNLERYYDNVDALSLNLAMALKLTSSIYRGHLFQGVFYGPEVSEILIAHNQAFDPLLAHREWENLSPVTVLRHPRSDLGLNLPDGTNTGVESGLAVIAINIPMLALQYRAFRMNEIYLQAGREESQRSIYQFIHMYVLPNMLPSHLDLAIFNRFDNFTKGAPLGASTKAHPFYLTDFSAKITPIQLDVIKSLDKQTRDLRGTLRTLPAVARENMEQVLRLPEMAPTMQVDWALSIARLPQLLFLFRTAKAGISTRDRSETNKILRQILAYQSNNTLRTMLPIDLRLQVENEIAELVQRS